MLELRINTKKKKKKGSCAVINQWSIVQNTIHEKENQWRRWKRHNQTIKFFSFLSQRASLHSSGFAPAGSRLPQTAALVCMEEDQCHKKRRKMFSLFFKLPCHWRYWTQARTQNRKITFLLYYLHSDIFVSVYNLLTIKKKSYKKACL